MSVCGGCGRPRKEGSAFCTGCGQRYPGEQVYPPSAPKPSPMPRRLPFGPVAIALAIVVLAAGGAGIALLLAGHHAPQKIAARNAGESAQATAPPSQDSPADGSAAAPSQSAPSPGPSGVGQVTIAPDAAQDADASSAAAFLNQYFSAINAHNYQAYDSLLSSQVPTLTEEQFDSGYGTTADSAETLVSISTAANGDLDVAVTFTSHQNPADSPNRQEPCTDWNISLFLEQDSGGYLIDQPPSDYHAQDQACS
jgi:hypothetical protein